MTYQPVMPINGYAGWKFLQRTFDSQTKAFEASSVLVRDVQYFEQNINNIDTAEQLVSDRRLLRISLGAFGLSDDLNNRYFIKKILEDGTLSSDALANKLSDKRYNELSKTFGFGDFSIPRTKISDFANKIINLYRKREFEAAVGEQNPDFRLALNLKRELSDIVSGAGSDNSKWFRILGTPPIRSVFEAALGLPQQFGQIDIDKQVEVLKEKTNDMFELKNLTDLAEPQLQDKLVQKFLLRSEANQISVYQPGSVALALLTQ